MIELNCDMGESCGIYKAGNDDEIMPLIDIANVACGRFDGYWQHELNYWYIAAGIVILKEAGGFIDFLKDDRDRRKWL